MIKQIILFLVSLNYLKCDSDRAQCEFYKSNYERMKNEYYTLYNSSFGLYQECTEELDNYIEKYSEELEVSSMCMQNIKLYERQIANLSEENVIAEREALIRETVLLESNLLKLNTTLTAKLQISEKKLETAYKLIDEYMRNISMLEKDRDSLILDIRMLTLNKNNCEEQIQTMEDEINKQEISQKKFLANINDCIEREEICQNKRNTCVQNLSSCRRTKRKFKEQLQRRQQQQRN